MQKTISYRIAVDNTREIAKNLIWDTIFRDATKSVIFDLENRELTKMENHNMSSTDLNLAPEKRKAARINGFIFCLDLMEKSRNKILDEIKELQSCSRRNAVVPITVHITAV